MRIQREESLDLQMNEPSQRTYLSWQRGHHRLALAQGGGGALNMSITAEHGRGGGADQAEM